MPPASRRRERIVRTLLGELEAWGYGRVQTPLVEPYDVIARGLSEADRAQCVRFIEAGTGTLVALRADVTPQIARLVADRFAEDLGAGVVHRYCYAADIVRQPATIGEPTEQHQVGVELLGDGDAWADVELVALCDAALRRVGLARFSIDVAHAQLARAVIDGLGLPADAFADVHGRLVRKDRGGVERVLLGSGISTSDAAAIASLCDRLGPPSVVAEARREIGAVLPSAIVDALARVVDGVTAYDGDLASRLTVDLGETRGFDYYSGVRMRVWAPGVARPVVRGGRYDAMLGRYGAPAPATGFAIDLDALEQALALPLEHDGDAPMHAVLVAPGADADVRSRAASLARRARESGEHAWVQHAADEAAALSRAAIAGAEHATWICRVAGRIEVRTHAHDGERWRSNDTRSEGA
jgi:ATP phosphoribosyltransferase regulatory subunit